MSSWSLKEVRRKKIGGFSANILPSQSSSEQPTPTEVRGNEMVRPSDVEANGSSSSKAICGGVGRKRGTGRRREERHMVEFKARQLVSQLLSPLGSTLLLLCSWRKEMEDMMLVAKLKEDDESVAEVDEWWTLTVVVVVEVEVEKRKAGCWFPCVTVGPNDQDQNGPTGKGSVWVGSGSAIDGNERGRALFARALLPSPPVVVLALALVLALSSPTYYTPTKLSHTTNSPRTFVMKPKPKKTTTTTTTKSKKGREIVVEVEEQDGGKVVDLVQVSGKHCSTSTHASNRYIDVVPSGTVPIVPDVEETL
ncbi:hypothetical protein M0804_014173 [Polistes exclamans]|nr:hypothetical protein M0804_014174 [Polistes exclamans]KAI4475649.1 hypothetical protein M0804_014173 [Polistes exclamans]